MGSRQSVTHWVIVSEIRISLNRETKLTQLGGKKAAATGLISDFLLVSPVTFLVGNWHWSIGNVDRLTTAMQQH